MTKTRVVQVRLILSAPPPHVDIPDALDYPLFTETRAFLFNLLEHSHVVRMDAVQLSPGEFDHLRSTGWPMRARRSTDWWFVGVWVSHIVLILGGFALLAILLSQCLK